MVSADTKAQLATIPYVPYLSIAESGALDSVDYISRAIHIYNTVTAGLVHAYAFNVYSFWLVGWLVPIAENLTETSPSLEEKIQQLKQLQQLMVV